ncbi:MAG: ATP-binding protein [Thermodesulfobacteriota bacterium]|nr:ATP-binding protein [Thermodesulfobacteriota bacterium]
MLNNVNVLEILSKWNSWDRTSVESGVPRQITGEISNYLDSPEVIVLKGVRRSGKSTIMFQVMNALMSRGISSKSILYVNFEEPFFAEHRRPDVFERLFNAYREEINPTGRVYVFLDEVQEIPMWEKWVRTKADLKEAKIFVTGSSSKLLGTEFSTLLTGRNISFTVFPLAFREFLSFKGFDDFSDPVRLLKHKPLVKNLLREYMQFGGFPEVVLRERPEAKDKLLKQYFEDILYKDVVWRYQIRDIATLKNIALLCMANISNLFSYNKIKNALGVPLDVVRSYSGYMGEAYLIKEVLKHSFKVKEQLRNPKKIYAVDMGLRNAVSYRFSEDLGRIAENIVAVELMRQERDIYYYKNKGEVDFLVRKGIGIEALLQVCMTGGENEKTLQRELDALKEGMENLEAETGILITEDLEKEFLWRKKRVTAIPLWKWLIR